MNPSVNSLKGPFFTSLFIFLFLFLFSHLFGPIPFSVNSVQTTKTDLFTVQETGEESAVPDTAQISMGITETASTVQAAQDNANSVSNKITEDLKSLGVDPKHIKTTNYSVSPNYDYQKGNNQITGYTVSSNLDVEVTPLEKANQAIDIATKDGANQVGDVTFTLADDKKTELENKAREQAITKAKNKAQTIAQTAGIRLGRLINVQETTDNPIPIYRDSLQAGKGVASQPPTTDIQPGQNSIKITVTLSYETL